VKKSASGEPFKPKETLKNDPILKAEKELELAREKYVGANFETENALSKISKFLHMKGDLGDKEALDLKHAEYRNKLNELLSLKIDELKRQNPGKNKIGEKINKLVENFNLKEEAALRGARGNAEKTIESFRSAIALNKSWEDIKDMSFSKATEKMNWRADKKMEAFFKDIKERFGDSARPGASETLENWTERVFKLSK